MTDRDPVREIERLQARLDQQADELAELREEVAAERVRVQSAIDQRDEARRALARFEARVVSLLRGLEWSTGYDQCPECGGASPTKMESYRATHSGPGPFQESDFGHQRGCHLADALAALDGETNEGPSEYSIYRRWLAVAIHQGGLTTYPQRWHAEWLDEELAKLKGLDGTVHPAALDGGGERC